MKHLLLILISLLLLSSPVIGDSHKGETLYRWGENPPYVWKDFREKETQPKYLGDVKDGKPDGFGILTYSVGYTYVGEWKNGEIYNGTLNNKRGDILFKWVNGKRTY
jgi:hypothetical protein